jgi:hypothetical protein
MLFTSAPKLLTTNTVRLLRNKTYILMHYQEITEHVMIYNQGLVFTTDSTVLNSETEIKIGKKDFSLIDLVQRKHRAAIHILSKRIFRKSFIPVLANNL